MNRASAPSTRGPSGTVPFARTVLQLAPSDNYDAAVREAMAAVVGVVQQVFGPYSRVVPFGSLVQGAHLEGSDLDLCIEVPDASIESPRGPGGKADTSKQVATLRSLMRRLPPSFRVIETRFWKNIKVPIVIVGYTSGSGEDVETDISVGVEYEGVEKGFTDKLIRRILARTPRVLHAARFVKQWAKAKNINKAYEGYLNSLGWTLLVLYYFIEQGEVSCDELYVEAEDENCADGELHPSLRDAAEGDSDSEEPTRVPTAAEMADFFDKVTSYDPWPEDPPAGSWAISLVDGMIVEIPEAKKQYPDQCSFFLEDPGIKIITGRSENVARALKWEAWQISLARCREAASALRTPRASAWAAGLMRSSSAMAPTAATATAAQKALSAKRSWPGEHAAAYPEKKPRSWQPRGTALQQGPEQRAAQGWAWKR
mmetsp:Transcript_36681/g.80402  ORF Transcript_36681/g.80402 Transcript_36681/m.80402 type:complete len:428 (-) Transcript_36681:17-1300(-)